MIGAGKKNKLITIQQVTQTVTDEGEATEAWTEYKQAWAAIEPLSSREQWYAKQSQATQSHKITIWYVSGITTRMRATWDSRTFNFDSVVNPEEADRELVINATEVTTGN